MKSTHEKKRPRAYRGDGRPWGRRRWLPAQVQDVAAAARGQAIHYAHYAAAAYQRRILRSSP